MNRWLVGIGVATALAMPGVAHAQAKEQKVFVRPMVGGVVGAGPGASFSGSISFKAGSKFHIFGEGGRLKNILPKSVADEVEVAAAIAANTKGSKHSAAANADASYGLFGVRHALRDVSGANTFVEIGVGMARVTSKIDAVARGGAGAGDISNLVHTAFTNATPESKPMASVGAGIVLGVSRSTAVEIGARYVSIFTDAKSINMSNIFGGFRFGF